MIMKDSASTITTAIAEGAVEPEWEETPFSYLEMLSNNSVSSHQYYKVKSYK
jgi:hypothetical protein